MATILVVDDDSNNRLLLKSVLGFEKHTVLEAEGAAEGLTQAAVHTPDLIVVDLHMPDIDGVSFVRALRADPSLADTAIALYTGTAPSAALDDFIQLYRVNTVIPKPSEPEEILRKVRAALTSNSRAS